ncbi:MULTISPECIES: GNAT family N-acetyltransferase [Enterobacter]|jgi:GNAT superfamily N-acetyltransferase|uniref:GCN5 family acetyltransferase n=1 Tax=Enterobacter cloacae subsp. cloacae TaxID=336306 RepID=A0AAE2JP28_ENTCL|nr:MULTISPECIES: GNAT family N-acetyltransferase [Enterobacter]EGQ5295726.1 GNAT family N-acetyltransferase [Enterobacter cloacae]EKX4004165.1 GNAT family N-acetyltransferase [Enterobacter cloacae]EKX4082276.1 GNAT family N-acetyltransferase [Enterobacter cloacae]ELE9041671.1 GNAT family N-acetyltransferase [Enterobacter cloacae]KJM31125.1 GCN5 family acetyltransferase [Enterobacter cloacae subsp. cloacae]
MRVGLNITVRPTRPGDVTALPAIERAAGERFRDYPELAWLAEGDVISAEQHLDYAERGLSWLALANELPVGFILAETHVSSLFIVELSVHLDWQGKGIGRRLIACVADQARKRGLASLTLTTFRDVPWNAPFYARLGFEMITTLTPELREKREEETAHGLAYDARCAMRLPL